MDILEELEQEICDNNINLVEYDKINDKSAITRDNEGYVTIAVNKNKVKNDRELLVALSHEYSHYRTSGYYRPYMLKSNKWKMEYNANVDSIKRLVPLYKRKGLLPSW